MQRDERERQDEPRVRRDERCDGTIRELSVSAMGGRGADVDGSSGPVLPVGMGAERRTAIVVVERTREAWSDWKKSSRRCVVS